MSKLHIGLFKTLLNNTIASQESEKRVNLAIYDKINASQEEASQKFVKKKLKHSIPMFLGINNPTMEFVTSVDRHLSINFDCGSGTIDNYNVADLGTVIGGMIYCTGLPFSFGENYYFKKVLKVKKTAAKEYVTLKKDMTARNLLNLIYKCTMEKVFQQLSNNGHKFGLVVFGDAKTIEKSPLVNVLVTVFYVPAMVIMMLVVLIICWK